MKTRTLQRFLPFALALAFVASQTLSAAPFNKGKGRGNGNNGNNGDSNLISPLYANPFIGGAGSYQGATLIGEALQGSDSILLNSGDQTELNWVASLVSDPNPELPSYSLNAGGETSGPADKTYAVSLPDGWDYGYYMAKWGNAQNPSDHAVWLLEAGDTLLFQLPNGLSHSKIWLGDGNPPPTTPVPDGGATAMLLLGGVALLEAARRKLKP